MARTPEQPPNLIPSAPPPENTLLGEKSDKETQTDPFIPTQWGLFTVDQLAHYCKEFKINVKKADHKKDLVKKLAVYEATTFITIHREL
eukprot:1087255-Karenia_brevis.AAC.1